MGTHEEKIAPERQEGTILESWAHPTQHAVIESLPCDRYRGDKVEDGVLVIS